MTPRPPLELVILPLLTLLSLAFSMWSGLEGERLLYARIWGGPPVDSLALRVQVIEEQDGLQRGLAGIPISLRAHGSSGASVRELTTGADGWVDAVLPLIGPADGARVEVRRAQAAELPLARGPLAWSRAAWSRGATEVSGIVPAEPNAKVPIAFRFEPPVLSAPFPGDVVLEPLPSVTEPLPVRIELVGAQLLSTSALTLVPGQPGRLRLRPIEHTATLTAIIDASSTRRSRTVTIPIRAGSLTAEGREDHLIISSPVPRARAYYSVVSPAGRLGGGEISLEPRADGTAAGRLARGALPLGADRYLVLSSSPDTRGPSLVGLPLDGQPSTFDVRDALLLDGRPAVLRTAGAKRARVRFVLLSYAALGAALSVGLFVWHIRRANERLRSELADVGAPAEVRDGSHFGLLSAVLSLLFAFGLALTWILVR